MTSTAIPPVSGHGPEGAARRRFLRSLLVTVILFTAVTSSVRAQPPGPPPAHLVAAEPAERRPVRLTYLRTGTLRARRTVRIFNQEEGRITRMPFYEGDRVRRGERLAELDDALLRALVDKARATRRKAETDLERVRELISRRLTSEDELSRVETALEVAHADERVLNTRLGFTRIDAPFAGIVTARLVEPGDAIPRHTHILTLADPDSLVTELSVSELLVPYLRREDSVQVRIDALGPRTFRGRIARIHPTLDPQTRRGRVEIELDPVPQGAMAGQFCRVTLHTPHIERLTVPFRALRHDRKGEFVYRVSDGVAHRTEVNSGLKIDERVEIVDGLQAGELVVVRGFLGLHDGKEVVLEKADATVRWDQRLGSIER